jgi:hypothetical protein
VPVSPVVRFTVPLAEPGVRLSPHRAANRAHATLLIDAVQTLIINAEAV